MSVAGGQLPLETPVRRHLSAPLVANWWVPLAVVLVVALAPWVEGGRGLLGMGGWDKFWAQIAIVVGINLTLAMSLQLINGIAGQFSLGHAGFMAVGAYIGGYAVTTHGGKLGAEDEMVAWVHPGGVLLYVVALGVVTVATAGVVFGLYKLVGLLGRVHKRGPAVVFGVLLAWLVVDIVTKGKSAGSNPLGAIAALGWGSAAVTGSFDWIMLRGAGAAEWMSGVTPAGYRQPACLVVSLLGGGVMAAMAGLVVGLPTLRLRGDYLAIATLGVSELIRTTITNSGPLGRATGLSVPTYSVDAEAGVSAVYFFPWVYGVAILTILVVWRIQHSPKGRALQCLREDEIAAGAVGIDVTAHKVLAFVIGAGLAGMGGALFAHYIGYINPKQFDLTKSIELVVMVTLGGLGSVPGTIVATVLLSLFQPALQTANQWMPAWAPGWATSGAELLNKYRLVIYSLLLIVAILVRSRGWLSFGRGKKA